MLNTDYNYVGNKRHIKARYGDGQGNPYRGPLLIKFVDRNTIAVLSKDGSISLQTLRGNIEYIFHPLTNKEAKDKQIQDRLEEKERDRDGWQQKYLAKETNETMLSEAPAAYSYIDSMATSLCVLPGSKSLIFTDSRCCLKLVDLSEHIVTGCVGKFGANPEDFTAPTAVDSLQIGNRIVICACDAGSDNHRLQVFDKAHRLLASVGGVGPQLGQFRDPVSVACHYSSEKFAHTHSIDGDDCSDIVCVPYWFRSECLSLEELEDQMYGGGAGLSGNFLVARRQLVERSDATAGSAQYDLLHITPAKVLQHFIIKRERHSGGAQTYCVSNLLAGGETEHFPSLWALLRARRHLTIGDDPRPFALVAVADRGNFRVQVFRYFWTSSDVFAPGLEVAAVIGGPSDLCVKLRDPVCVAYSGTGELAICDSGSKSVVLLSPTLSLIKVVDLLYESPRQQLLREAAETQRLALQRSPAKVPLKCSHSAQADKGSKAAEMVRDAVTPGDVDDRTVDRPSSVAFSPCGNLAVGYKSGGLYVFEAYRCFQLGHMDTLQTFMLERIILQYLGYEGAATLRDCCRRLHDITRDLRLQWRLFPGRAHVHMKLRDDCGAVMCPRFLDSECPLTRGCELSHGALRLDAEDLCSQGGYFELCDLRFCVAAVFGARFQWRYEVYIDELFQALSDARTLMRREDRRARSGEAVRNAAPEESRALSFRRYLELMTVLEEQFSGTKQLHSHKLFHRSNTHAFQPRCYPISLQEVVPRLVPDPTEQYDNRGINVPHKVSKGARYITRSGMESAVRTQQTAVREHIDVFQNTANKAAAAINSLFI